jgi:hypothetical protein
MLERSLKDNIEPVQCLPFQAHAGALDGAAVSTDHANNFTFLVNVGVWTSGTHTLTFYEDLPGDGTWTACAAKNVDGYSNDTGLNLLEPDGTFVIDDGTYDGTIVPITYVGLGKNIRVSTAAAATATYGVDVVRFRLRATAKNPIDLVRWNASNTPDAP